ncbi:retrovirus-related pol polyprotein from transposon TNT 1-94 [Tanacetum coccineum]
MGAEMDHKEAGFELKWLKMGRNGSLSFVRLGLELRGFKACYLHLVYVLRLTSAVIFVKMGVLYVESINGKKYILVIVDDYSRFTWVKFPRSKDEAPDAIIKYIKNILVCLNATVRNIRTDNGTKFINQTLRDFYENVSILHQTSVARTPQQNGIVKRRNRTLVEAAHTMLIFLNAPLFLWAEAINTACYTQNRSLIRLRYNKTPY